MIHAGRIIGSILLLSSLSATLAAGEVTTVVQTDAWTGEVYQVVGEDYGTSVGLDSFWMVMHRSVSATGTVSHLWSVEVPGQRPGGTLRYTIGDADPVRLHSDTYQFTWVEPQTTVHWYLFGIDDMSAIAHADADVMFEYQDATGTVTIALSTAFREAMRAAVDGTLESNVPTE